MAETNTAPSPSFSGIDFNPDFFSSSTSLTLSEADALYLNKATADTANVLETFTVGISANALQATTATITSLQVSGTIVSNNLILIGGLAHVSITANYTVPSITAPYTSSMPNKDFYIFNQSVGTITITLPATPVAAQVIHIRNASNSSITIAGNGKSIYPNVSTGNIFTSWTAFATNTSQNFEYNGTAWIGH